VDPIKAEALRLYDKAKADFDSQQAKFKASLQDNLRLIGNAVKSAPSDREVLSSICGPRQPWLNH
jgi:phage gp45-like